MTLLFIGIILVHLSSYLIFLCFISTQVAAGGTHSVVLTREGHVWTWGQPWPPGDMYDGFG